MLEFDNDHEFRGWCQSYPEGLVVNTNRNPNDEYFVLHSASCPSLRLAKQRDGAYTQRGYRKFAAMSVEQFRPFMRREGISDFSKICSRCSPRY